MRIASVSILMVVAILCASIVSIAAGQITSSSFSYQGELKDGGTGINADRAHFIFQLWDAPAMGRQIGSDVDLTNVVVTDGVFTVFLDFGENAFNGNPRYLAIRVDPEGGDRFVDLAPRQPVTAAPFAVHALHGGDNPWRIIGDNVAYTAGHVGVGTTDAHYPLTIETSDVADERVLSCISTAVSDDVAAIYGEVSGGDAVAVRGVAMSPTGGGIAVHGEALGERGTAIYGASTHATGTPRGLYGSVRAPLGIGIYGLNTATDGEAIALYGESRSPGGFGGYFLGKGYFSGRLGIGTTTPTTELDVAGTVRMNGFKLGAGGQSGYVLTSDASGNGTWQPSVGGGGLWQSIGSDIYYNDGDVGIGTAYPSAKLDVLGTVEMSGLKLASSPQSGYVLTCDASGNGTWQQAPNGISLPYTGSVSTSSSAFKVTNTGSSSLSAAIHGVINNASGSADQTAGLFNANGSNGYAIQAFSDGNNAIFADHNGGGWAVYGTSEGAGGAWFTASGSGGEGVRGTATGEAGHGVYATASGGGAALVAEATGASTIGIYASGSNVAARFKGNVDIYEYGTNNKVIELGKGLDYAEGFDVTEADTEDLPKGTVLVIDSTNPGHLTRCTQAYDRKVAGIVAGANGLGSGVRLGADAFDHDVALAGRVYCNVVALDENVEPGDLLTTSNVPGHAMKVSDHSQAQGAVLGKAMEPLAAGTTGQILVLVTLQ